jgi:GNAT superfamily N-acetyltransferase
MSDTIEHSRIARGIVRKLIAQELPLLREHLLRLDHGSRYNRFNGFIDDSFIERYAGKCATDGTVIVAYIEDATVRGAAELHQPDLLSDPLPEIAFSVEACVRRRGLGTLLFRKVIAEAKSLGYQSLRITTGSENEAMRALAHKFGAHLTFRRGESTGTIDLAQAKLPSPSASSIATSADIARAIGTYNRAWWKMVLRMYGWGRTA